ncbi:uncharacterized protein METZ01_LOCUS382148, partial [marine metagenome]
DETLLVTMHREVLLIFLGCLLFYQKPVADSSKVWDQSEVKKSQLGANSKSW